MATVQFRILGPLEVLDEVGPVALGGIKARAVLAVLLLHPEEPVTAERLSLALWGEEVPASAVKTVQVYVSRLRKALGDAERLVTTPAGYLLRVHADELDADRFTRLVEDGRRALRAGQADRAATVLREALSLWRGPALADLAFEPFADGEIPRLEEQRLAALEARVEADLASGRHAALVGELRRLVSANPTRERLAGQLMLALYRCGRQTDALEAFHEARRALLADVGVEPGPELRRLEAAILRQDASLEAPKVVLALPPELEAAGEPPLVGRDAELARLRAHWDRARTGRGAFVTVTGVRGIGKSRLAAELAGEVDRDGSPVLYADGAGPPEATMAVLARARQPAQPALLVVEAADEAAADVLAALTALTPALPGIPLLVIATGTDAELPDRVGAHDSLGLGPLAVEAVSAISVRYAPSQGSERVPADRLLQDSAGVPRRVHEVASQWGQRIASHRVSAVAERAAASRSELRAVELELAGDVVELHAARARIVLEREDEAVVCPFKGLASFEVADARYFFGRERLVAQLVARLVGAPLLALVGPSGSGKSSVLRAGLLPALAGGVLPGSEHWPQVLLRPGEHPLRELDDATTDVAGDGHFVVAVDQFEETFTACGNEREREAFVAELVRMADAGPGIVVLAIRADHYGRCAAYPKLSGLLAANHVLVGPMRRDELRRAVLCPAQRAGLHVEPELADAIVADVADEPGALPLLSAALLELWQQRDGRHLRHVAYEHTGGVRGAVTRLAEDAFTALDEAGRTATHDLMMRLIGLRADGEVERRRVSVAELPVDESHELARVLVLFTDRRLLTVSAGTVEVAHEALLREWPRLDGWIEQGRDELRIKRALAGAAEEWQRVSRDDGALVRGTRLAESLEWRDARGPPLSALEHEFLDASESRQARERTARRRRVRLTGAALATLAAAAVAIIGISLIADRERDVAASRDLAAKSVPIVATDPRLALTIALEALRRSDTRQAQNAVRQATLAHRETRVIKAHKRLVYNVALSRDGRWAATAGGDGTVCVWRLADGRRAVAIRGHGGAVRALSFSRNGKLIASATSDGAITVARTTAGRPHLVVRPLEEDDYATSVEFGRDDGTLVIGTDAGRVAQLRLRGDRLVDLTPGHKHGTLAVRIDRDAERIVSTGYDGLAWVSDARGSRRVALHHGPADVGFSLDGARDEGRPSVLDASFSQGGGSVATVDANGALRLWDASHGTLRSTIKIGDKPLASVRFSGDDTIVVGGYDGVIHVVTVHGGGVLAELRGHRGPARADITSSGTIVSAGEEDGTLRTWVAPPARVARRPGSSPRFSRDRQLVVSGDPGGEIHVWRPATGHEYELAGLEKAESFVDFAPAGHKIVGVWGEEPVGLWDAESRQRIEVSPPKGDKLAAAIDPKGERIAIGGEQTPLVIQRPDGGGAPITLLRAPEVRVNALAFDPAGTHLLAGSDDETPRIWNAATGALERILRGHEGIVRDVSYSDDGRLIATASSDGTVRVWPAAGGDPVTLFGHESGVNTARFDASGDRLVSAGDDGTVRVWDTDGGEALVVLRRYQGVASGADFGEGYTVVSAGDGIMLTTPCEVCGSFEDALRAARTRPQRRLGEDERRSLLAAG